MTDADVEAIASGMDGRLRETANGRVETLLPSDCVQNHSAFLSLGHDGLHCLWFGGSLEGKSDISVYRSTFAGAEGGERWGHPVRLSDDPDRSEQNPVQFDAPDGRRLILHTAQEGGNQDDCILQMREEGGAPVTLDLPRGTFIRGPIHVRDDGAWLLPLFRCVPRPGERWTGSHDTAALAISADGGTSWREVEVPGSTGCVHMTLVPLGEDRFAAFFRRRQADYVYRSESRDGGENWSVPQPTDVPNNNASISVIALRDGRLAMACNPSNAAMFPEMRRGSLYDELDGRDDRPNATGGCNPVWGVPRAPMSLCFSTNAGLGFQEQVIVEDGSGLCLSNDSLDGKNREMSYPSLLEVPEGDLHLAYTYHRRAIKYVRLSRDWLEGK